MAEAYTRLTEEDGSKKDPFEAFVDAPNLKEAHVAFKEFCQHAGVEPFEDHATFYERLKAGTSNWKAKELFKELDKKANRKEYNKGKACPDAKVFIIGAGPCGLRMAIELALLGCKVVLVEKRDSFTRNNVLYLWNYLISDLTNLGAKKVYGRFGAGDINHISIIKLQVILLKVALILGVEIHYGVEFLELDEKQKKTGWRANVKPKDHKVAKFEFTYIIAADGRQNTLPEFEWKESSRTLAIGITANFVNKHSQKDAVTKEIAGKSYIYDQDFFQGLKKSKNIDLENIVYYKDETHYFVMTAKKTSLLEKGVIKKDEAETNRLLALSNVNNKKLQQYTYEAAFYATEEKLPTAEFAKNYRGEPDIAMFDFTSRKQAKQPAIIKWGDGKTLVMAVVGDSLKEPFWPEGTGCALGFLGVFDTAWMVRDIATGERTIEEALQTRGVIYKLLSNTKPEDLSKNYDGYGIDPRTRYTSQVAKNCLLYKEEPKKVHIRRNSSSDSGDHRQRPVSEFIKKDKEENKGRERLNTTAFSMKRKKNQEEAEKRKKAEKRGSVEEKSKGSIKEKKEKSFKMKKKDSKKTKEGKSETEKKEASATNEKKDQDKEKEMKKKKQEKEEKMKEKEMKKKQEEEKAKEKKMKREKKKEMKRSKKKKSSEEMKEDEDRKRAVGSQRQKTSIQDRINQLQAEGNKSMKEKSRSLDRRDVSFSDARKRFEDSSPKSGESSPARSRASTDQEEEMKTKKRSRWSALKFWKGGRSEDDTDGKKKNKTKKKRKGKLKKLRRKLSRKGKKSKTSKREGSYTELDMSVEEEKPHTSGDVSGRSSTSSLANKASPKDQKKHQKGTPKADEDSADDVDGPGNENRNYDRMDDSDEPISKQIKSDRSSSFLHKLRPKKRKSSKYDDMQKEAERPIGS